MHQVIIFKTSIMNQHIKRKLLQAPLLLLVFVTIGFIKTGISQQIDYVEYGIDGIANWGNATRSNITVPAVNVSNHHFTVDISAVNNGFHQLFVRSHSSDNKWSVPNYSYFYKAGNIGSSIPNINKLEYFIDADPGIGNANPIAVTAATQVSGISFTPNIGSLGNGFHTLFIRSLDATGKWSVTNYAYFFKASNVTPALVNINKIEYFIDTDPGINQATSIPITPALNETGINFSPSISSLSKGFHTLFIRSLDANGKWSITNYQYFYKAASTAAPIVNINKMEYFFDTDPGIGHANNIVVTPSTNVSGLNFNADVSTLTNGFHTLFIRSQDANGKWSITNYQYVYKTGNQAPVAKQIVKIEYYIDNDPGYYQCTDIPVSPAQDIANKNFTADITGLSVGRHYLNIRSLDNKGYWSVNARDSFLIGSTTPLNWLGFTGKQLSSQVLLNWATNNEINCKNYIIEHSADGIHFTALGAENAINNISTNYYQFTDEHPFKVHNFYRIRQVDFDGRFMNSRTIDILYHFDQHSPLMIYPIPATTLIHVENAGMINQFRLQVFDQLGQLVIDQNRTASNLTDLDISHLPAGMYRIKITDGHSLQEGNFIKTK